MSRLLTTLLLYRSGFYVGKYISLEAKIAKNKDLYYDALELHRMAGMRETMILFLSSSIFSVRFLLAYKDFADRFALVERKLPALETVRMAAQSKIGRLKSRISASFVPR